MTNVISGHSERSVLGGRAGDHGSLRKLEGCNVIGTEGAGAYTGRKNQLSTMADTDQTPKRGKAGVSVRHSMSSNPILTPDKGSSKPSKRASARNMHEGHGNIIIDPPEPTPAPRVRAGNPYGPHLQQTRRDHGDIISGRDQQIMIGTGRRRTEFGRAIADHGTLGMLHWSESSSSTKGSAEARHVRNSSAQMRAAIGGEARPTTAPVGHTSIERLAMRVALAVSGPRDNAAGSGLSDLNR